MKKNNGEIMGNNEEINNKEQDWLNIGFMNSKANLRALKEIVKEYEEEYGPEVAEKIKIGVALGISQYSRAYFEDSKKNEELLVDRYFNQNLDEQKGNRL